MQLSFHIKFTDGRHRFEGLDQYNGATALLGLSQVFLIAINAFYNKEILTQAPSAKGFRVVLGKSKVGSWDQYFNVIVTDPAVLQVATDLGKSGLYDLLKWALTSGIGAAFIARNRKAKKIIRELEKKNDDLHEKLEESIKRMHSPVKHQGLTVHIMSGQQNLATFNEATLRYIETEVVEEQRMPLRVGVSRFNARTGTGRFILNADAASVPFYPADELSKPAKRLLVDSLAWLTRDRFLPVDAIVSKVTSADGHLKSYRVHAVSAVAQI